MATLGAIGGPGNTAAIAAIAAIQRREPQSGTFADETPAAAGDEDGAAAAGSGTPPAQADTTPARSTVAFAQDGPGSGAQRATDDLQAANTVRDASEDAATARSAQSEEARNLYTAVARNPAQAVAGSLLDASA